MITKCHNHNPKAQPRTPWERDTWTETGTRIWKQENDKQKHNLHLPQQDFYQTRKATQSQEEGILSIFLVT